MTSRFFYTITEFDIFTVVKMYSSVLFKTEYKHFIEKNPKRDKISTVVHRKNVFYSNV